MDAVFDVYLMFMWLIFGRLYVVLVEITFTFLDPINCSTNRGFTLLFPRAKILEMLFCDIRIINWPIAPPDDE